MLIWEASQSMRVKKQRFYERLKMTSPYSNLNILQHMQDEMNAGHFHIYLQPKIDFRADRLAGMEALIRHIDDNDQVVPLIKYIPVIEKAGCIRYIDFFVLEEVCKMLISWKKKGYRLYPVSVNFSRATIREPHIAQQISEVVDRYWLPHSSVLIEITESAGDMEREIFITIGQQLIDQGFGVSLDDFGSKYSCTSLLAALPFAEVKIDRSMLMKILDNAKLKILYRDIVSTCHTFVYRVIAEGVETREQLDFIKETHCDLIQGYYYSRPIPIQAFEEKYLRNGGGGASET